MDLIDEKACRLIRITDIHINLNRTKSGLVQPAHIVYELEPTTRLVRSLKASWIMSEARPMGSSVKDIAMSCALMSYAFVPILVNFGMIFAIRYFAGVAMSFISGGTRTLRKAIKHAEQGNEEAFVALFFRPDSCCIRSGSSFLRPADFLSSTWSDTASFTLLDTLKSSGRKATMVYQRKTKNGKSKIGYFEVDTKWTSLLQTHVEKAYVFEEDEVSPGTPAQT